MVVSKRDISIRMLRISDIRIKSVLKFSCLGSVANDENMTQKSKGAFGKAKDDFLKYYENLVFNKENKC